ncbi:MAG: hypothetical protein U0176_22680 [Bacteroidia bacterium]
MLLPPAPLKAAGQPQLIHIMGTGQSVSLGMTSLPALSLSQPYNNYHLGTVLIGYERPLVPLVEISRESPCSGTANSLHAMDSLSRDIVITGTVPRDRFTST